MFDKNAFMSCLALDLGLDVVELNSPLTSDVTPFGAACRHMYQSALSKFLDDGEMSEAAKAAGEEKFLSMNNRSLAYVEDPRDELLEVLIGEFRKELYDFYIDQGFSIFSFDELSQGLNVGPGASIGSQSYNFYTKLFDSDLTATHPYLFSLYRSAIATDPAWSTAESYRQRRHGYRVVGSSRLFHVPKKTEVTRTATTLPLVNMLFQKASSSIIEKRLVQRFGIHIRRNAAGYAPQQERQRVFARRGSRWGSFGTIDGKSASDCINIQQLDHLPSVTAGWLKTIRAETTVLPDGRIVGLGMVGTMGEGFTFSFQTAYFACLVRAVYRVLGIKPTRANYGVYGDDIIVRRDAYDLVIRLLKYVGQLPNEDKSFNSGYFRESCGGDYWKGYNIRPVQIQSITNDAEVYSAINRLNLWSQRWIPLVRTVRYLQSLVARPIFVPPWFGESEGIHIHQQKASDLGVLKRRPRGGYFIRYLQDCPYRVKLRERVTDGDSMQLLHYCADKTIKVKRLDSKGKFRKAVGYNPWGLMVSFLGGYIENGYLTLRVNGDAKRYKVTSVVSQFWDHPVGADRFGRDHAWQGVIEQVF